MRIYDPRAGRFLSVDPITKSYPELAPYQFAGDSPIEAIDLDGLEPAHKEAGRMVIGRDEQLVKTPPRPKIKPVSAKIVIEQTIAMADINGRGWIGPAQTYVLPNVAAVAQAHRDEVSDNIKGGPIGAIAYLVGGDKWSYVGATGDGVMMSAGGSGVPGVFPTNAVKSTVEPVKTESPIVQPESEIIMTLGTSGSNDYRKTFFTANPDLLGQVIVHHAIEQQVLKLYPGLFTEAEIHSIQNLRGIPNELNNRLHLSDIRIELNRFYKNNPNATREEVLKEAVSIDNKYGSQFNPPVEKR